MGKTKNLLEGIDDALERADDAYQYEQWRNSKEYVDMANEEFALHKPKHSDAQIDVAISEAFKSLQVTSEEVGIDVYEKLFRQHFYENL